MPPHLKRVATLPCEILIVCRYLDTSIPISQRRVAKFEELCEVKIIREIV